MRRFQTVACLFFLAFLAGCGASSTVSSNSSAPAAPVFSPSGGTYSAAQNVTIATSTAGAAIYYTADGSTPSAASTRYSGPVTVSASSTLQAIAVAAGRPSSPVAIAQYAINAVQPLLSTSSFAFPQNTVGSPLTETVATVSNPSGGGVPLSFNLSGDPDFSLVPEQSCSAQLAAGASCPLVVRYLPSAAATSAGSLQVALQSGVLGTVALSGNATPPPVGSVSATTNPLVALFAVTPQAAAAIQVQFGPDTTYGYTTAPVSATAGSLASLQVAGMRASSTYHLRASIAYLGGNTVTTPDQTFTTGALPSDLAALQLTATTTPGLTPQPGVEIIDPTVLNTLGAYRPYAVDLQGNIIWYYPWNDYPGVTTPYLVNGIKQLPNGDYLAALSPDSAANLRSLPIDPTKVYIREFDLIGNTVRQLSLADLNTRLAAAGYNLTLIDFHHDVTPLPNGHWLLLASTSRTINGNFVQADAVIDVDTDMNPVFVWNEFDHLDTSRQPFGLPDLTHSNAVIYSPTDGNFLVSIRHQNWIVKVRYQDGLGDGAILWRLGSGGDFTLVDSVDPQGSNPVDWQYAQHAPSFVGPVTAGTFSLAVMDNGNDRILPGLNAPCPSGQEQDCYTTVPIFRIDETALTATVSSRITLPPNLYSNFAGNAEVLANSDLEYDLAGTPTASHIAETLPDSSHTLVWSLDTGGAYAYRGFRLPSLYPGVQWP